MLLRLLPVLFVLLLVGLIFYSPINLNQTTAQSDYKMADVLSASGDFDSNFSEAVFNNQVVSYPGEQLAQDFNSQSQQETAVLGTTTNSQGEEKWIEVDLAKQQLTAWEGNKIVRQFLVSTGRWGPTPPGTFHIWYKTRSQRMTGGSKALGDFYDLPNVPNNMFFNGPIAIHGAYWHNNFGHPMSHGCVNEPLADAAWMFEWAGPTVPAGQNVVRASDDNPGTRVWVH
jgi:lipoprotein-anchoring transpeptidase ErfK/SrfK